MPDFVVRLAQRVFEFSGARRFVPELERAIPWYWGDEFRGRPLAEALARMQPDWARTAFIEWFLYDFPLQDNRTILEHFLKANRAGLKARERAYLEQLRDSYVSLYQVEEVRPDEGLLLRDLFLGQIAYVSERLATRFLVRWDILAARLAQAEGKMIITGSVIPFRVRDREPLVKMFERGFKSYRKDYPRATKTHFLKDVGEWFNQYVQDVLSLPPPQLITAERDPVVVSRSHYQVVDRPGLLEVLRQIPDIEQGEAGHFTWHEFGPPDRPQRILGSVDVRADSLELFCMSKERLAAGRALLEERAGMYLRHRADSFEDPWAAAASQRGAASADEGRLPPDVEAEAYRAFKEAHTRKWLDEPVPALGGHTPREAVQTPPGRKKLAGLLREIENTEERHLRDRGFGYDASWLWNELGVDPAGHLKRKATKKITQ